MKIRNIKDKIFREYLEELSEQAAARLEWQRRLAGWHGFNTFYTLYTQADIEKQLARDTPGLKAVMAGFR